MILLTKKTKILLGVFGIGLICVLVLFVLVYLPLQKIIVSAKSVRAEANETYNAVKIQDIALADEKIKVTKEKTFQLQKDLRALFWLKSFPIVGGYLKDADHGVKAGIYGLEAGEILIESIEPYADLLGFKGQGSFIGGPIEERVMKAVQTLDKITPNLDKILEKMALVKAEIDQIDPQKYPEEYQGQKVRSRLSETKILLDEGTVFLMSAKPLITALPGLLGEPKEKKYLVLFQNDKELRATGGFITAYAVFRIEHGKIFAETSDDIYNLDNKVAKKVKPPELILKYLPLVYTWNLRDANTSPDFKISMQNFEDIYKGAVERIKYDGIVALDTHFVVGLMKVFEDVMGPLEIYGTKFTYKNSPACNCPMIIYELEKFADKPVAYERGSRKDLIGVLMKALMERGLKAPKQLWGSLGQTGLKALEEKHLLIYLHDEEAQKGLESLNFAGRINPYEGDYLHINDTNYAGAKSNMYVEPSVEQKIEIDAEGAVTKTLVLNYKNPQASSDCDLEHGQLCLNGLLRNVIRIYVPEGAELLESRGSEVKVASYRDLGKTVFEGFVTVRPLGSAQVQLKYKLPGKLDGKELKMLIQKQSGTEATPYAISVNGKLIKKFNLNKDQEIVIKI